METITVREYLTKVNMLEDTDRLWIVSCIAELNGLSSIGSYSLRVPLSTCEEAYRLYFGHFNR